MENKLTIYNTLSRKKELFEPINPPFVGLYVCGPTVYGDAHLGHARPAITFDLLFRYLKFMGYRVRYVRNITDVGHLVNDADEGEDKIAKKAKLDGSGTILLEPLPQKHGATEHAAPQHRATRIWSHYRTTGINQADHRKRFCLRKRGKYLFRRGTL